jgi:hypothetical protein
MTFLLGFSFPPFAGADLSGNCYTDPLHHVSFGRPNEAWKFLDIPSPTTVGASPCRALAVFSNGDGQAIAMLAHCPVQPVYSIHDASDLNDRWPSLVGEIISLVSTGESSASVEDSTHEVTADGASFDIRYRSASPADGEFLENWVAGFLVRDTADQQHIYAIRCAAPQAAYKAWESDFARIMPTLRYEGPRRTPVFIPKSNLKFWFFLVGFGSLAGIVLMVLRSRKKTGDLRISMQSMQNMASAERVKSDMENIPDQMHSTHHASDGPERVGWPDNASTAPDRPQIASRNRATAPCPASDLAPISNSSVESDSAVAVHTEPANGFWKCACGRINPASHEFCARCNLDRPKK